MWGRQEKPRHEDGVGNSYSTSRLRAIIRCRSNPATGEDSYQWPVRLFNFKDRYNLARRIKQTR
jgi:hypothetical protein